MKKHLQQLKGMQSSKWGKWKGYHLSKEGIREGYLFHEKWHIKGYGFGPRGGVSPHKNLLSTPPPSPPDAHWKIRSNPLRRPNCLFDPKGDLTPTKYNGIWYFYLLRISLTRTIQSASGTCIVFSSWKPYKIKWDQTLRETTSIPIILMPGLGAPIDL